MKEGWLIQNKKGKGGDFPPFYRLEWEREGNSLSTLERSMRYFGASYCILFSAVL
jgi:hypothetical protein